METHPKTESNIPKSFCGLVSMMEYFSDEKKCIDYFVKERWTTGIQCPHCLHKTIFKFKDNKRYKCARCRKHFNVKTGTIFENSKISLRKWLIAIYLVTAHKKGISSHQLAKDLEVTQKTAWFMLHRIRYSLNKGSFDQPLGDVTGTIEMDETFVGGKNKNRHAKKKVSYRPGRGYPDKTPVLGMIEREGRVKAFVVSDVKHKTLLPIVEKEIYADSLIITDEWWVRSYLNRTFRHAYVTHSTWQYVKDDIYTNSIEGFWTHLKRSLSGIYHRVTPRHLQHYVNEAVFRYNTRSLNEFERTNVILNNLNHRLTYKKLTEHAQKRQTTPPSQSPTPE